MKYLQLMVFILISTLQAITLGEHYEYRAYLGPFYLGEFSFEVQGTENMQEYETYHIYFKSNIRQIDKESHIYLRVSDLKPVKVVRYYFDRDYETEIYDPEVNIGVVYHKNDFSNIKRKLQGSHELHTPLSLLLYLREQKLVVGNSFQVETTDETLQVTIHNIYKLDKKDCYRVSFEPMGLTVFYLKDNQQIIPEVRWRLFFHDVRIRLK